MMKIILFLVCVISPSSIHVKSESILESIIFKGIPKKTPDPININTSQVVSKFLPPMSLHGIANDQCKLVNNGKSVELLLNQPASDSVITGGILGKDEYEFYEKIYFWTENSNGIAATTIDGKGVPLNAQTFFFNRKYGSFQNALNYRDGLVKLDFPIGICSYSNPLFDIFYAGKLKQVRNAGSSVETTLGSALVWYAGFLFPFNYYYTYPGSYHDEKTGKIYYSVTAIVIPNLILECLSKKQFEETWGSLKDASGKSLSNTESRHNRSTKVVKSFGIVQTFSLHL